MNEHKDSHILNPARISYNERMLPNEIMDIVSNEDAALVRRIQKTFSEPVKWDA